MICRPCLVDCTRFACSSALRWNERVEGATFRAEAISPAGMPVAPRDARRRTSRRRVACERTEKPRTACLSSILIEYSKRTHLATLTLAHARRRAGCPAQNDLRIGDQFAAQASLERRGFHCQP